MKLSPSQRAAIFEKMKQSKMSTAIPKIPMPHQRQLGAPPMPPQVQGLPVVPSPSAPMNPNMRNDTLVGPARAMRFKKIKSMLGQ